MLDNLDCTITNNGDKARREALSYLKHAAYLLEHGAEIAEGGLFVDGIGFEYIHIRGDFTIVRKLEVDKPT